jgi:TPR repeat protein
VLGGVFISYRREDSGGFAGRIYDWLTHKLGHDSVFFDVDNIPVGLDFVDILSERVGKCDALIAVIGKSWAASVDDHDRRRLDDPNDFVRIEIEAALARKVRVIPVLVDGAAMPRPDDLPDSLKKLTRRQGIEISHTRFDSDVERLTRALTLLEEELRQREAEAAEAARRAEQARQAAEAERAAFVERERREADEAAARAERERQLAAEDERLTRQERERRDAAKAVEARQAAEAEAARRGADEQRHVGLFVPERTATGAWDRIRRVLGRPSRGGSWGLRVAALALGGASVLLLAPLVLRSLPPAVMTATEENEMGDRYFSGRDVEQDYAKAFEWYRKAADHGLAAAEVRLGYLYKNGLGALRDIDQARIWYQKAADQGNGEAKAALQQLQPQPNPSTQTTSSSPPPVPAPQEQRLTPAEENDEGNRHLYGRGVEKEKAMEWYRKAADSGFAEAQHNVGMLYENGWGVAKDIDQARIWYQRAADQGYGPAQVALQRLQPQSNPSAQGAPNPSAHNASPNSPPAAAPQEQSLTPAEENEMGDRYFHGNGVAQDYAKAMEWYRKAADQGSRDAQ